ncbi:MAG TPA: enoyl-CoA hydratase-related protein [Thermoleophilaceae bacterium]|jgi:2-(1,2-epoxy-1,2-dihydrophenyl)acetyl-CoA isomerase|nr:enoyl-CoA hydratase-related protein [Thermoleophilaceae bacterium]
MEAMRLDVRDGIARLTFTQAERGNPIDGTFCGEINEVSVELSERRDVRAVVVAAEGKAFSYGGDIASFLSANDHLPRAIKVWTSGLHMAIARLQRMDPPIVAAVHGICAGGMTAFVAGCDFVVASSAARFVAAYAGIGYSCDAGASVTLTRRLGPQGARRFLLLDETLDAGAALAAGLADEVVDADALEARATELAAQLAAGPTRALGEIRRLLLSAGDQPLETQLELEAQALARMAATPDAREGLAAFAAKRRPAFTGR